MPSLKEITEKLLDASGYLTAADLSIEALQSKSHGPRIDGGLDGIKLILADVADRIRDARSTIEDMELLAGEEQP